MWLLHSATKLLYNYCFTTLIHWYILTAGSGGVREFYIRENSPDEQNSLFRIIELLDFAHPSIFKT
jgi:hypothetical protein